MCAATDCLVGQPSNPFACVSLARSDRFTVAESGIGSGSDRVVTSAALVWFQYCRRGWWSPCIGLRFPPFAKLNLWALNIPAILWSPCFPLVHVYRRLIRDTLLHSSACDVVRFIPFYLLVVLSCLSQAKPKVVPRKEAPAPVGRPPRGMGCLELRSVHCRVDTRVSAAHPAANLTYH